ncbi:piggyBac transposable element-derived protein 4 [Halyomorpha halys]|uniref:piggyBac transposable element-derived protein 4 n=1 Tax=Halyomorpha halys TaxID=286706 RepID=UPI0006D4D3B6|nr:piggyBac transposable element-derived protein 4-like [Halyomorpha halys]
MSRNQLFTTPEEALRELRRQQEESDSENQEFEENVSEPDDDLLQPENRTEELFDAQDHIDNEIPTEGVSLENVNFLLGRDNETIWADNPVISKFCRTPNTNIITHLPGPKSEARGIIDEHKLFSFFINDEILNEIVVRTNFEIERVKPNYSSKQWFVSPTSLVEIKALIGLLLFSAILKDSNLNTLDMFSKMFGPSIFRSTMTEKRFHFLLCNLRFDDKTTREARRATDKFAPFRNIWTIFEANCSKYYSPSEYVTIDETLLGFRGKCPFKTYIPSKPDKYGLKIISACDARTFYFMGGIPYVGKTNQRRKEMSLPTQYVLELTKSIWGTKRNVTVDNWFCSYQLAEELGKKQLTLVGTLRKNKPQVPLPMFAKAPVNSSKFLYQDDKTLLSYTPKKDKKVLVLSSMHFSGEINEISKVPEMIEFYNLTKGGVDVLDKLCHDKTTKRSTNRWPMRYFFGILDISAVNAFIIWKWNGNEPSYSNTARTKFIKTLAFTLTEPMMKQRAQNQHLPKELRSTICNVLGLDAEVKEIPTLPSTTSQKRKRCGFCNANKDRKGNFFCCKCNLCLCGEHKVVVCSSCLNN